MTSYSAQQRYQLARQAGFSPQDAVTATAISLAENGSGDPALPSLPNKDGSVDLGLWQINQVHWPTFGGRAALQDALTNAKAAFALFTARHGFDDWTTFTSGVWRVHLPEARAAAQQVEAGGVDLTPTIGPSTSPVAITNVPISTLAGSASSSIASAAQQSQDVASSTANSVTDAVQNAAKGIGAVGASVGTFLVPASKVLQALSDTHFLWRILLVAMGIGAITIGLVLYIRPPIAQTLAAAAAA